VTGGVTLFPAGRVPLHLPRRVEVEGTLAAENAASGLAVLVAATGEAGVLELRMADEDDADALVELASDCGWFLSWDGGLTVYLAMWPE
jgi:hypothetical protein